MRASDIAYEHLRAEIIDWVLEPGTPLNEIETAERIGVSRTPVREALARLTAEGLVASIGRTARVAPLSRERIIELYELREALETSAAKFAARRRDPARFQALLDRFRVDPDDGEPDPQRAFLLAGALDEAIDEAAGSRYIRAELDDLRGQMARVRNHSQASATRLRRAGEEQILIIEAILAGDETLAVHATAVHVHNSLVSILEFLPQASADAGAGPRS
ncbi:GntR family transcriptional regulator [Pseudonocardia broussonetiae]|uniref:GntR family transcriptional regulator n=1 Tax=Pseudonocardia broussonetiae TaxID=2736640 RepID=A0A6M6JLG1_9PSEU|nr:GntR family transcriptional regulator [Pseudonocardia broussonetiae]QJY48033.1 GntR family transcriptional regulator [Pseudonocardia broussonetiae]